MCFHTKFDFGHFCCGINRGSLKSCQISWNLLLTCPTDLQQSPTYTMASSWPTVCRADSGLSQEFIADVLHGHAAISNTIASSWPTVCSRLGADLGLRNSLLTCPTDLKQCPTPWPVLGLRTVLQQQVGGKSWPQELIADVPNGLEAISMTIGPTAFAPGFGLRNVFWPTVLAPCRMDTSWPTWCSTEKLIEI